MIATTYLRSALPLALAGAAMFAPAATAAPLAPDAKPPAAAAPTAPDIRERTLSVRTMRSKGGLDYTIFISAPKGPPPPGGFPVLYVVDGNAWFGLAAEVARLNEIEGGPSIVVGVGYAVHTLYDDARRNQDFTVGPPPAPPPGSAGAHYGGAPAFIDFLRHDLRDAVGKAYKIDPARQSLFGHSLGGWFALHVLFTAPDAFSTVVVASPAIWWDDKTLMAEEQAFAAKPPKNPPKVLITIGGFEQQLGPADTALMTKMYALNPAAFHGATLDQALAAIRASQAAHRMVDRAREMADLVRAAGVPADFAVFDGENHRSEVPAALSRALPLTLKSP